MRMIDFFFDFQGSHDVAQGRVLHKLIQTDDFRVVVVADVETVELCGALKVQPITSILH